METMHLAVQRESAQTRKTAGILDGSTLGKIEIRERCIRIYEPYVHKCIH